MTPYFCEFLSSDENYKSAKLQEPNHTKNPQTDKTKGYKFPEAGLMENVDRSG